MNALATATRIALGIGASKSLAEVSSLAEAGSIYGVARDAAMLAGKDSRTFAEGRVYDLSGAKPKCIARVSWNGSVWPNEKWTSATKRLYPVEVALLTAAK